MYVKEFYSAEENDLLVKLFNQGLTIDAVSTHFPLRTRSSILTRKHVLWDRLDSR